MKQVLRKPFQKSTRQPNEKIFKVLWKLKQQNKADDTIKNIKKCLYRLHDLTNLDNPEDVITFVANFNRNDGYKRNLIMAYEHYVKFYGLTWKKPKYHEKAKLPRIPQETKIDQIIANSSKKLGTALSISKDTGLRPVELMRLKRNDIDLQTGAVYPETAKHGSPRVLKLTQKTLNVLNKYVANRKIQPNERLFRTWNSDKYGKWFRVARNRTAEKLQDPFLKTIRLYDLRHFFATMLYHKTKDILYVKQQMGHKKIETTLIYTQLLQFDQDESYTCKVARTQQEMTELIESGFTFVNEKGGLAYFRKRK